MKRHVVIVLVLAGCAAAPEPEAGASASALSSPWDTECDSVGPAGSPLSRGINCRAVMVDAYPRFYVVYVPHTAKLRPGEPAPVVFMFHGSTGTAGQFLRISGWREKAEETGLIAVFPQGLSYFVIESGHLSTKWNAYALAGGVDLAIRPPGYPPSAPWPADDVSFTGKMLDDVQGNRALDERRAYASGFSNGGSFCFRVAVEMSDRIAAAGCSSGGAIVTSPPRRVPFYKTMGDREEDVVAMVNAIDNPQPPLVSLPLTAGELLALTAMQAAFHPLVSTFADSPEPDRIWEHKDELRLEFGGLTIAVLKGVTHQYPNGRNNPLGFVNADRFWTFFKHNPMP